MAIDGFQNSVDLFSIHTIVHGHLTSSHYLIFCHENMLEKIGNLCPLYIILEKPMFVTGYTQTNFLTLLFFLCCIDRLEDEPTFHLLLRCRCTSVLLKKDAK